MLIFASHPWVILGGSSGDLWVRSQPSYVMGLKWSLSNRVQRYNKFLNYASFEGMKTKNFDKNEYAQPKLRALKIRKISDEIGDLCLILYVFVYRLKCRWCGLWHLRHFCLGPFRKSFLRKSLPNCSFRKSAMRRSALNALCGPFCTSLMTNTLSPLLNRNTSFCPLLKSRALTLVASNAPSANNNSFFIVLSSNLAD